MEYTKQALTFRQQAEQLLARGLLADRADLEARLEAVSYYRLAGYWHPFRVRDAEGKVRDEFVANTRLGPIWDRYCFDRRLRGLVMDAIERIEVSMRTKLVYHFSHRYGPFGYLDPNNLPKMSDTRYGQWIDRLRHETGRSKEEYKRHFFKKYGDCHDDLPLWMLTELMSMGSLMTFYRGLVPELKRKLAAEYGLGDQLIFSWLGALHVTRNICAHHSRLWNRRLGYMPKLPPPNKHPEWHQPDLEINRGRIGVMLLICRHWLALVAPQSTWQQKIENLFDEFPSVPVEAMGLPVKWRLHPVWCKRYV